MTVLVRPPQAGWPAVGGPGARERDQLGRIPQDLWEAPAEDDEAPARYYGKVYWRGPAAERGRSGAHLWLRAQQGSIPARSGYRPLAGDPAPVRRAQLPGRWAPGRRVACGELPRLPCPVSSAAS